MAEELLRGRGPGEWMPILLDDLSDNPTWRAVIVCLECQRPLVLQRGHSIASDGQVTPSVGHPEQWKPCGWHPTPRLVGWENPPDPPAKIPATCVRCNAQSRHVGGWGTDGRFAGIICANCKTELAATPDTEQRDG